MAKLPISEPPSHVVKETKDSFSIDDFELDYVLEDVKRMENLLHKILTEQKEQTKLLQTIASSMEQITNLEIAIDSKKLSQILSSSIGNTCSKTS